MPTVRHLRDLTIATAMLVGPALGAGPATATAAPVDVTDAEAYPPIFEPNSLQGPRDIVLLGADLTEIAVALGAADRILARPDGIDLPGIEDTPNKVREWAGVEGVLAMGPSLVIGSSPPVQRLIDGLGALGVQSVMVSRTLPAVEKVQQVADLLGVPERGEELVAAIEADYAEVEPAADAPRLLHISKVGAGPQFTAGGAATAVDNLIARVGAINTAAEIGRDRYRPVTPESVLQMAPDAVLIAESELPSFGGLDGIWSSYPGLQLTPAGRNRNVIVMRDLHVRSDAASSGIATRLLSEALQETDR